MNIEIPKSCVVALIGPSGSGKSTFAAKHFARTEVLSSDFFRGLVADNENAQHASQAAFDALYYIAGKRLESARLTVIDATNVNKEDRARILKLAREHDLQAVALVLNLRQEVCRERNKSRPDRDFGPHVIARQHQAMRRSLKGLRREGFRHVHFLNSEEEINSLSIERVPLWTDRRDEHGPFDIIGDVHGCFGELTALLTELGYHVDGHSASPPEGRRAVFVGDLCDRGPDTPGCLRLVMNMVREGAALCVPGNHDIKLLRKLNGKNVKLTHGLAESMEQLEKEPSEFLEEVRQFIDGLVSHFVLDDGKVVVAHAGMIERYQGRASGRVREFALYGETACESDEFGLPIRYNWASDYRGEAMVVYGHTPVPEADWLNRTINIDTGCVFGGKLTALRYPECDLVSVPAERMYADPIRPLALNAPGSDRPGDLLDIDDVTGKRIVHTRLRGNVTIRAELATSALEVMSRFAADPRWLIYLPPTMSPPETSNEPEFLEHPREAFAHFRAHGVERVICEEKHMGSRAVVIVCQDKETAARRFGIADERSGIVYTRTGRPFFNDHAKEDELLSQVREAVTRAALWEGLATDWLCLDCELMPWSAKAQALLTQDYAPLAAAGLATFSFSQEQLRMASERGLDVAELAESIDARAESIARYRYAYRNYCWPVEGLSDLRLAPFHVLAAEGAAFADRDHAWHMDVIGRLREADTSDLLFQTTHRYVDLADEASEKAATDWWLSMTESGGEGMVVKPIDFVATGPKGLVQPAVKCRGREYLRIIYGPEYLLPGNLERLLRRNVSRKRGLALREFALGVEALERFVRGEPLHKVHECVFGVLALESEPVDPRL